MVQQTLLSPFKKIAIPFGVISSGLLFSSMNKVSAESFWERGSIEKNGSFTKEQLSKGGDSFFSKWEEIGDAIGSVINWIKDLPDHISQYSVDLLSSIYELLTTTVLYTPLVLFNSPYLLDTSLVFAGLSILLITILTMVEGIKKMLKKKNTDLKKILKRYSLAIIGTGFAPFLFEYTFRLLNYLSKSISKIGAAEISQFNVFGSFGMGGLDVFFLLLFDLVVVALLIPIILQTGRRWFDLMVSACMTPLAMTTWIFDDHKHYFNRWWSNLKTLSQTQLIYAGYICLMGVFIFATAGTISASGLMIKLLVILGGLYRMVNVPTFVKSQVDNGKDIEDVGSDMVKTVKGVYETITLKNLRSTQSLKKSSANKKSNIQKLRKKHGRRFVKNLT